MNARYDFWLGEKLTPDRRQKLRHKRDGLCHECPRVAAPNRSLCRLHREQNNQRIALARARKKHENSQCVGRLLERIMPVPATTPTLAASKYCVEQQVWF